MIRWNRHKKHKLVWGHRRHAYWCTKTSMTSYPSVDIQIGKTHNFHIVGSIHLGSKALKPLPKVLHNKISTANALIVESNILKQEINPPIVSAENYGGFYTDFPMPLRNQLNVILSELNLSHHNFEKFAPWHLALLLQAKQAVKNGLLNEYGIDYQALEYANFLSIPIIELEGQSHQLALLQNFDNGGLGLLEETILYWDSNLDILNRIIAAWENHTKLLLDDIEIPIFTQNNLLSNRNEAWAKTLLGLPPGNYVVVVGALHITGFDPLQHYLKTVSVPQMSSTQVKMDV